MHIGNKKVGEVYLGSTKIGEGWTMVGGVLRQVFSSYIPPQRLERTFPNNYSSFAIPAWADRVFMAAYGGGGAGGAGNGGNFTDGTGGRAGTTNTRAYMLTSIPESTLSITVGRGGSWATGASGYSGGESYISAGGTVLMSADGGAGGARGGGGQGAGYNSPDTRYDPYSYFSFGATGGYLGSGRQGGVGGAPGAGGGAGVGGILGNYMEGNSGGRGQVTIIFVNDSWFYENN